MQLQNLTQVSKTEINTVSETPRVYFCIRNEKFRLPFFLQYYRDLGVKEFFAVDNASTDDTLEYLLSQPDVHSFYSDQSYIASNAGRAWTSQLSRLYSMNQWALTLDSDEFLIYPGIEYLNLPKLCSYMERWGYQGLFCIFLDFYSDKAVDDTHYTEGENVFDVCGYHDSAQSYSAFSSVNFPYLQIKGGVRHRKFWDSSNPKDGPSMRKLPLIKWDESFDYIASTHSTTQITLADVTGALAHFKFLSHFGEFARSEVQRNDRVKNSEDWHVYANRFAKEKISFLDDKLSVKYRDSMELYRQGMLTCSVKFRDFRNAWDRAERLSKHKFLQDSGSSTELREEIKRRSETPIQYDDVMSIWTGISNLNLNLPYSNVGRRRDDANSLFKIEDRIYRLLKSRSWGFLRPIRKLLYSLKIVDRRALLDISENVDQESLYTLFRYTYDSFWWDILAIFRLPYKVIKKSLHLLKRLPFTLLGKNNRTD